MVAEWMIVDGLPLWHGAQLAIDTILVSPFHGDGTARRQQTAAAGQRGDLRRGGKSPFGGPRGRGGRTMVAGGSIFLRELAKARVQAAPLVLQGRVQAALVCSLARDFAVSLLELWPVLGAGEEVPPMNNVLRDARFQCGAFSFMT